MSADDRAAPGARLLTLWQRLSRFPGGQTVFSLLLGRMVPYTGALGARVRALAPGQVRVELPERRGVRNHLGSIHAVALVNLAELAGGLAVLTALPPGVRGIVVRLSMEYAKKARGTMTALASVAMGEVDKEREEQVTVQVLDHTGEVVARGTFLWRLRPPQSANPRD